MNNLLMINQSFDKMAYFLLYAAAHMDEQDKTDDTLRMLQNELVDWSERMIELEEDHVDVETIKEFFIEELDSGAYENIEEQMRNYLTYSGKCPNLADKLYVMKWIREYNEQNQME